MEKFLAMKKHSVLFLCTGNSCRSQMAEAIINSQYGDEWEAVSAGTQPAGFVHPLAVQVLSEIGIHHQGTSKSVDVFRGDEFDLVNTVCEDAEENCPVWLGNGKRVHVGFPDPAKAQGSEADKLAVVRAVLEEMRIRLPKILKDYQEKQSYGSDSNIAI